MGKKSFNSFMTRDSNNSTKIPSNLVQNGQVRFYRSANQISLQGQTPRPFELGMNDPFVEFVIHIRGIASEDFETRNLFVIHNADNSLEYSRLRFGQNFKTIEVYDVNTRKSIYEFPFDNVFVTVRLARNRNLDPKYDNVEELQTLEIRYDFAVVGSNINDSVSHVITLSP